MAYDYTLPDGSSIRVPSGTPASVAEEWARRDFPELYKSAVAPTKQKEGFFANVGKGWKGLAANNSLGIGAFGDEQVARDARRAVAKEEEAVKTTTWEDVKAAGGIGNTLSTAGAFARDSLAGTLPYMAQTAAGAKLGSMAGSPLGPGGALVGGALGAVGANLPALFGSNLARQDQENPNAPLNKTAAAAAAVPQAALDAASTVFLFGRALGVNKLAGEALNKLVTKSAAEVEAKLVASAQQSLLKASAKGAASGAVVEMPTELAQTVLERWQAGLALTGADANKEYEATLAGAAAVGGALGPVHSIQARNAAQATIKEREQVTADAARADALLKDEAEKQKQAEYRKTPGYLLDLDQKYAGYEKELRDLMAQRAALGKPLAGTSEAAQATALGEQIKALRAGSKELAAEHAKNKAAIIHAKIDPQEAWAAGAVAEPTVYAGGPRTKDEFSALREKIEGQKAAAAEVDGVDKYVTTQADAARNYVNGLPDKPIADVDVNDYVEHILADPAQAAAALNAKVRVPGATPKQNNAIWGLVKLRLAEQAEQAKKAAEEQTRIQAQNDARDQSELDLATQATNATQETDPLATFKESLPEPTQEEPERPKLDDQLTAWGLRNDDTVQPGYLDGVLEKALGEGNQTERTVSIPEGVRPLAKAPSVFQHLDDLYAEREAADKALGVAVASKNRDAQVEAAQNREQLSTTISRLVDSSPIVGGVVEARKAQDAALADAATLLDDLNANRVLGAKNADARGSASSTPETLMNLVSKARQAFVQAVIKEAAITRAAFGKALTEREALRTAGEIQRVFNEWMTRAAALPRKAVEEDRMVSPAQMRGTEIVRGAEYEKVDPRPPRERRLAAFGPASEVLQEQIRKEVGKLTSVPDQSFRVEQPLKTQFAPTEAAKVAEARGETAKTRGGELRRRREYVTDLIDKALQTRGMLPAVKSALERAAQAIESGKGSTDVVSGIENNRFSAGLLDSAEELARRVLDGSAKKTNTPRLIAEIDAALKDTAPAEGQGDLFDATPQIEAQAAAKERIQKLEAQVAELRAGKFKSLKEGVSAGKRITDLEKAIALLQGDKKDRLDTAARDAKKEQARLDGDIAYTRATAANFAKAPEVVAGRKSADLTREIKATWDKFAKQIDAAKKAVQTRLKSLSDADEAAITIGRQKSRVDSMYRDLVRDAYTKAREAAIKPEFVDRLNAAQDAIDGATKWIESLEADWHKHQADTRAKTDKAPLGQVLAHNTALANERVRVNAEMREKIDAEKLRLKNADEEIKAVEEAILDSFNSSEAVAEAAADKSLQFQKKLLQEYADLFTQRGLIVDLEAGTVRTASGNEAVAPQAALRKQQSVVKETEKNYAAEAAALRAQQEGLGLGGTRNSVSTDRYGRRIVKTERIEPITERDERLRAEREARREQDAEEITQRQAAFAAERKQHQAEIDRLTKEADAKREEINAAATKKEKKPLEKALALTLESLSAAKLALSNVGKSRAYRQQPLTKDARPIPTMRTGSPESAAETNKARASEGKLSAREQEALDSERATALWKKGEENFTEADKKALLEIKKRRLAAEVAAMPKKAKTGEETAAFDEPERGVGSKGRTGSKVQSAFDGDYESTLFRTGQQADAKLTPEQAQSVVDAFLDTAPAGLKSKIKFYPSARDIPAKVMQELNNEGAIDDDGSVVKGGVRSNGEIMIVGDAHENVADLLATLAHEVTGHYGVQKLLGDEGLNTLTSKLVDQGNVDDIARSLGLQDALDAARGTSETLGEEPRLANKRKVSEILAHLEERRPSETTLQKAGRFVRELMGAINAALTKMGLRSPYKITAADLSHILRQARRAALADGDAAPAATVFRKAKTAYANSDLEDAVGVMVGGRKDKLAEIRAHATGLEFRTRFIDAYAGIKEALKAGDPVKAIQVTYDLMNFAQRNHFVQQAVMHGTPTRAWWGKLHGKDTFKTEVQEGASLKNVSDMLGKVKGFGNSQATSDAFTLYALAKRAQTDGWDRVFADLSVPLKAGPAQVAEIEKENARRQKARAYADTLAKAENDPFKLVYKEYQDWNKGMLQFAQQAGIISEKEFRDLAAKQNYTPLFRADKFGNMVLEIDQGRDITVGRLADEPHMQKMLGGSGQVMDFFTASVRNASVIIDASLHNIASREAAMSLYAMGAAHPVSATEKGDNIVEFRGPDKDGKVDLQRFAVDTAGTAAGHIPTDLLVKGFAGVPASLPGFVRMMGVPAQVLRKAVTRNPLYMVRQLIRDPMSAYLTTGAKFNPVTDTLSEISKSLQGTADRTLDRRGITGGALFAENETDLERLQNEAKNNGNWWNIGYYMAALDHGAHAADAITRRNVYNGAIKEGASEIEATLAAYESMPFSKRGTSPSARYLNHMIPFLSAMIQGWDVMYRAAKGDMPLHERVNVRNKLLARGTMIAGITMMYAMANADDEDYKKANTSERLNNWFVRIPGMDNALKVPIPFELGIIFKMIPEAMVRVAMSDKDLGQEARDIGAALANMAPNLLMSQAMLPVTEAMLNRSFFTGRDIEGRALQNVDIGQRYDKNTSELSKALGFDFDLFGTQVGVSPKMLEYMASQYTGGLYGALAAVVDNVLPAGDKEKPDRTLAQMPLFKTVLLQEDAGGEVNRLYDKIEKFTRTEATFKKMIAEGDGEGAKRYAEDNREEFGKAKVASAAKAVLDKFSTMEKAVMAADWDGAKKKAALDNIKRIKSSLAEKYAAAL